LERDGGFAISLVPFFKCLLGVSHSFLSTALMRGMRRVFTFSGRSYSEQSSREGAGAGGFNLFGRLSGNPLVRFIVKTTASRMVFSVGVGIGMLAAGEYLWGEESKHRNMMKVFEKGGTTRFELPLEHIDRPDVVAELKVLLRPEESDKYGVVIGEHGTGKSTAVRDAIMELEEPKGVVYFSCPEVLKDFGQDMAAAVGYKFVAWDFIGGWRRRLSGVNGSEDPVPSSDEPLASYRVLRRALKKTARAYKKKHKRPLVLVIDAADRVAKKDPDFFFTLQDFAKDCADEGILRVVFVSSEGVALPMLQSSSAWSRALRPVEIGEISDEDAVKYLESRGVRRDEALDAVKTITGGRFSLLTDKATYNGKSNEEWLVELERGIRDRLKTKNIQILHTCFRSLLAGQAMSKESLLENKLSSSDIEYLLKENILSLHSNGTYSFQARYVQKFFEKQFKKD
jgi:hypothetical protein